MTRGISIVFAIIIALLSCSDARAERLDVYLSANALTTHSPDDTTLGDYYLLQFQIPQELQGKTVGMAVLELRMNVSSVEKNGYQEKTPLVELYQLKSTFSGSIDPAQFVSLSSPIVRNAVVGESRRVILDLTEIVNSYIESPASNHGVILGSLTGRRDGIFTVKSNELPEPGVARITFLY